MNNYVIYHLHTDLSNCNGFADSCTSFKDYIKLAKKQGMKAIAFSEHGNVYEWVRKKQDCDKAGIKFIFGVETYVCRKLEDDDRGCHIGLYARNIDGVKELNKFISLSTSKGISIDKSDRHTYYNPRISLDELMNTSNNIIVTTACLASPLWRWTVNEEFISYRDLLLNWMKNNEDRCFLEIQYHNYDNQKTYNQLLYKWSQETGIPLIAGTDTHSANAYKSECRKILQKSKDSFYGEEDEFDLTWKTLDELFEAFRVQNALPEEVYIKAIENTNMFSDMVEDFSLDKTFKYPTLYGVDAKGTWKQLIRTKLKEKIDKKVININKISKYKEKISYEFNEMCKLGMESFMLFMSELMTWCSENNIPYGAGRGSVAGSEIAYITDITDVDPVVWNTVFSRFVNADRVSLGDIDCDFAPEDREKVYNYIIQRFTPAHTAYIAAFLTLRDRGCIDVLAKGLEYKDLNKVMDIKNQFEDIYESYSKIIQEEVNLEELLEDGEIESSSVDFEYHEVYKNRINNKVAKNRFEKEKDKYDKLISDNTDLFYYLDGLKGTIIAKGTHPSGIIGSPVTLSDNIGLFYKDGNFNTPVSSCSMKAVDSLNYVKFDILGLKTVGIIKDTCVLVGIPYPKSHEMNWNDKSVWENMISAKQGVFQFEGDYAHNLLKDFTPKTINHMSMVNAALRPSGKSYRDRLIAGEFNENPSDEINELLRENNGFLIFQEDCIKFLTDICDFSGSAADTTRRHIGKKEKEELKKQLPLILDGYCKHSSKPREVAEEEAKQFIQIIQDSSEYQFGYNHSTAYSMNGYECTYLRTYYPLEFTTAYLNRAENMEDTNNGVDLAKLLGITINTIQFGKSLSNYTMDKSTNSIYKGIASIKFCNVQIANELIKLSKNKYESFIDLITDIKTKTSVNSRQLAILTGLNFFSQFGKNKYLLSIIDVYNQFHNTQKEQIKQIKINDLEKYGLTEYIVEKYSGKKTDKLYKELDVHGLIKELCNKIENKSMGIIDQIRFELEYLEYCTYTNPNINEEYYIVIDFRHFKDVLKPYLLLRNIKTGEEIKTRIKQSKVFKQNPFGCFSILKIKNFSEQFKRRNIGGEWIVSDETELILDEWETIK